MLNVYPGIPLASYHAFSTTIYNNITLAAYVSGTSVPIFVNGRKIIQILSLDTALTAVSIDGKSGKVNIKWGLELKFSINNEIISTLSWGNNEILIGGTHLHLYSLNVDKEEKVWSQKLSHPVIFALISPDSTLIATISEADHFIKIWKKPTLHKSAKSIKFVYLPHPKPITSMKWKQKQDNDQTINNILYSMSQDTILRIWTQENILDSYIFQLSYSINIRENAYLFKMPSNDLGKNSSCLIIDNNILALFIHYMPENISYKEIDKLIDIKNKDSDICLAFDENGQMWIFAISFCHYKNSKKIELIPISSTKKSNIYIPIYLKHIEYFAIPKNKKNKISVNLYFLHFGENIDLYQMNFLDLMNPSSEKYEFKFKIRWTGHKDSIESLLKFPNSNILLSKAYDKTTIIWEINHFNKLINLEKSQNFKLEECPTHISIISEKNIIILNSKNISVLEIGKKYTNTIATCNKIPHDTVLCFTYLRIPSNLSENSFTNNMYFLAITTTKNLWIWKISPNIQKEQNKGNIYIEKFQKISLPYKNDIHLVVLINPIKHSLYSQKDLFITISITGELKIWSRRISENGKLYILPNDKSLETKIVKPRIMREFSKKLAIICQKGKELTIWNIEFLDFSEIEEYRYCFSKESEIYNLDWTHTKNSQLILAIGFKYKIILVCETRYKYDNKKWNLFRSLDISGEPHSLTNNSIQNLVFLEDITLVIASKNQLFLYEASSNINTSNILYYEDEENIASVSKNTLPFGAILPVYHPCFLEQLLLEGDMEIVKTILTNLYKTIYSFEKINITNEDKIHIQDSFLGIPIEKFLKKKNYEKNIHNRNHPNYYNQLFNVEEIETTDKIIFDTVLSKIDNYLLSYTIINLNSSEQRHLISLIKCIKNIEFHKHSIDTNGIRYYLFFLKSIYLSDNEIGTNMLIKDALWALHSNSQKTLLYLIHQEYKKNLDYIQIRNCCCFFWLKNKEDIKLQMETIAHTRYITNNKNPEFCSLFYIALKKKHILLRLWKMATGHSNQKTMVNFLSNNFSETRWKIAAQKNAYVLLGKHHYGLLNLFILHDLTLLEYAAAFFLLSDRLQDAVNVCIKNLRDISLAIAISRVYEGDDGETFKNLLIAHVIPNAIKINDRWLTCWAFWMLGKKDLSMKSLILPLSSLSKENFEITTPINSKKNIAEDPALIILYKELKNKTMQLFKKKLVISQCQEFKFILYITRLYTYIGCDIIALNLVQGWNFTDSFSG
ncbi:hypothetical protein PORY_002352 [Pneumocystis oryctolagi]|uniref:Uncharacterized protein n=1 Tax=Pneumocystis oryctolagi TaxID=42067 RepID=A0ACB7C914_9ASCO|nr:hypothetical protein PORY_002352 [Pneumocystis oryctolagi]